MHACKKRYVSQSVCMTRRLHYITSNLRGKIVFLILFSLLQSYHGNRIFPPGPRWISLLCLWTDFFNVIHWSAQNRLKLWGFSVSTHKPTQRVCRCKLLRHTYHTHWGCTHLHCVQLCMRFSIPIHCVYRPACLVLINVLNWALVPPCKNHSILIWHWFKQLVPG